MKKDLPIFPDGLPIIKDADKLPELRIRPDTFTITAEHVFEEQDIQDIEKIDQIILWIYNYPEREFFLFLREGQTENRELLRALEHKGILVPTTELNFYRHPLGYPRDYVKIKPEESSFDWEREIVKTGTKFIRIKMTLCERKRRELDIQEKIESEKSVDVNPIELKPNFCGIGIDLQKAYKWVINLYRRQKTRGSGVVR